MRTSSSSLRLGLIVLAAAIAGHTALVTGTAPAVFAAAVVAADMSASQQADPTVIRSRYVTINDAPVTDAARDGAPLPLELFPGLTINAVFERLDPNAHGTTWVGQVANVAGSTVTLVYSDGLLTGSVAMPRAVYSIRPAPEAVRRANPRAGGELHIIAEVNQSAFLPEAPPIEVPASELDAASDRPLADDSSEIDLLVVYTASARDWAGGEAGINNLINLGVSETNTANANSGVVQRVRLVHTQLVPYSEVTAFATNLNTLRAGSGGLSSVPGLREAHRADLVTMIVRPTTADACGIGFLLTSVTTAFAPNGYNVVDATCVSPAYSFAHELGHNMGLHHDWYVADGATVFTYAHGFVDPPQRFRTIMAYADHCLALGLVCTRTLNFSNPALRMTPNCPGSRGINCGLLEYWFYPGPPRGVPEGTNTSCVSGRVDNPRCDADEARALNNTASAVANFRQR